MPKCLRKCRRTLIELHEATFDGRADSVSDLLDATVAAVAAGL
jgi:VanZ family protein